MRDWCELADGPPDHHHYHRRRLKISPWMSQLQRSKKPPGSEQVKSERVKRKPRLLPKIPGSAFGQMGKSVRDATVAFSVAVAIFFGISLESFHTNQAHAEVGMALVPFHNWDAVAMCESSGNWHINTGNGYYGGLQFSPTTWHEFGGIGNPAAASKQYQIMIAERILAKQGIGAWPVCGPRLYQPQGVLGAPGILGKLVPNLPNLHVPVLTNLGIHIPFIS